MLQRCKVIDHGASGKPFAGCLAENGVPVTRRPQRKNSAEKVADSLLAVIVAFSRVLLQYLPCDVVVKLELDHRAERVVVILRRVVVDVRLGRRVAERLEPLARWSDALIPAHKCPPGGVERIIRDLARVEVAFEVGHDAGRPRKKTTDEPSSAVSSKNVTGIGLLGFGGQEPSLFEIRPLPGRQADQIADPLVKRPVRAGAKQVRAPWASNS